MSLRKNKTMKKILIAIFLMFATSSLFAVEEYVSLIYKKIDDAFSARSSGALDEILKDNIDDRYYYLIENYAQKKIRRLILTNDYQFAQETTLVIIDNNLDNTDAVEMYSLIIDAYDIQRDAEAKRELARQEELAKIEKEKEKARPTTEKLYEGTTTASGETIYLSAEKDLNFTRYEWKAQIGLFNLEASTIEDGFSASASYDYNFRTFTVGGDLFAGVNLFSLSKFSGDDPIVVTVEAIPRIAMTQFSRKIFARLGFMDYIISDRNSGFDEETGEIIPNKVNTFPTPVIGVQVNQIKIGRMNITAGFDWYPAHLWLQNYVFAAGVNGSLEIPFAEYDKTDWYFIAGIKDKLFLDLNANATEWNKFHVILGIGAKNVIR